MTYMNIPTTKQVIKCGFDTIIANMIRTTLEEHANTPNRCLNKIDIIMNGHGVERIEKGKNSKSPSIRYVNMGDTYDTTIMYVNGCYRVGDWGSIVERGNYE